MTFLLVNHGYSQTILKKQGDNLLEIKSALEKNEHDKALLLIKQDLPFVIENRDSSLIVSYSYFQSKIYQEREQLDSSINVLIFAYRYARRAEDEVKVNYQLGEILLQMGAHELAIPYLRELVDKETDLTSKFYHYNLLGRAYILAEKKEESIANFTSQLAIAEKLKESFLINNAKNNLGLVYLKNMEYEQSKRYLLESINSFIGKTTLDERDEEILINAKLSLAITYYRLNDLTNSIRYFEEVLNTLEGLKQDFEVYNFYIKALIDTGETNRVKYFIEKLEANSQTVYDKHVVSKFYVMYYLETKQFDFLKQQMEIYQIYQQEVEKKVRIDSQHKLDLIGQFYLTLAENNIEVETIRYEELRRKKQADRFLFFTGIGIALLMFFVLLWVFVERQRRNKLEKQVILKEKENLDISLQLQRKDLSKIIIDQQQRAEVMNEFLSTFKGVATLSPETVKTKVITELKKLKNFNASRKTLNEFLRDNTTINTAFHKRLLELHPNLTQNDVNLCSYLLLGLSNKDIANLQGILPSSVRISKMRIKKKMKIDSQSLEEYLMKMQV